MLKNDNVLRITAFIIAGLLAVNFFFFKSILSDSKEEDKSLRNDIKNVSSEATENKSDIKVLTNDIVYIKESLKDIKLLIDTKLEKK